MSDPVASIPIPGIFERRAGLSFTGEYPTLTIRSRAGIREFCLVIPVVLLSVAGVFAGTVTIYGKGMKALTGGDIGTILLATLIALFLPFSVRAQTLEFTSTGLRVRSRLPWSQPRFYHWGKLADFCIYLDGPFRHVIGFLDKSEYAGFRHRVGLYLTKSQAQDVLTLIQHFQATFAPKENGTPTT